MNCDHSGCNTLQLQDLNWGAFDHASHAHQLRSCNYNLHVQMNINLYNQVTVYVHVHVYSGLTIFSSLHQVFVEVHIHQTFIHLKYRQGLLQWELNHHCILHKESRIIIYR